jgi:2,4-dienoyl-CoA reductase-like NADH-dependent reductase (Old Yellow Enzyme family)
MSILFEPINIAGMELPNRFVRSATHDGFSTVDGEITDQSVAFIEDLAKGGVGLIVVGFAYVTPAGQAVPNQNAIYDDRYIAGLKRVTEAVHRYDSKVVLQIGDCGSQSAVAHQKGVQTLAPSSINREWASFSGTEEITHTEKGTPEYRLQTAAMNAREMTEEDIQMVIQAHADAARRVRDA